MEEKQITAADAGNIQVANSEEIAVLNEQVIGTTSQLNKATKELEMLNNNLVNLSKAKEKYDEHATYARYQMQEIIPKL